MIGTLILGASIAASPVGTSTAPASKAEPREIVVTGQRMIDLREALARCIAAGCPPDKEIDAALALAEWQFERGHYRDARLTIRKALSRNRRHMAAYPRPVADLYRASTRVARHMGEEVETVRSARGIGEALEAGLGSNHPQLLDARYEYVDALLGTRAAGRDAALKSFERDAERAGRLDLAARARLKRLWVDYLRRPFGNTKNELARLSSSTAREDRIASVGATVLLATIYRREGKSDLADATLARLGPVRGAERVLLYAPGYQLYERLADFGPEPQQSTDIKKDRAITVSNLQNREVSDLTYMDVSFWIAADGTVRDVEVVRAGQTPSWAGPVLASIRGRRYSASADGDGTFKLERYTYTAPLVNRTGGNVRQRSLDGRIEYLDLTKAGAKPQLGAVTSPR